MKFRTNWNGSEYPKKFEVNNMPSCTIPDQSMTVQEIITRFANGLPVDGQRVPVYDDDVDMEFVPDLAHMDLADREAYIDQAKQNVAELQQKLDGINKEIESYSKKKKADQGEKVQRTSGSERSSGEEDEPGSNHPKKTRGAGAAPRDREKGGNE